MTTLDRSSITKEDICRQVVAMGGQVTNTIDTLAGTMAQILTKAGVQKRADGQKVSDRELADAACATVALLALQLHTVAFKRDTEARVGEPEVVEARREGDDAQMSAIAVQAAISTLLGDSDDPMIRVVELNQRRSQRLAEQTL